MSRAALVCSLLAGALLVVCPDAARAQSDGQTPQAPPAQQAPQPTARNLDTLDAAVWGVAIEKIARGHVLQLNFGNSFGTTSGMLPRGGASGDVYPGFNLSRKF